MGKFHEQMAEFFKTYGLLIGRLALLVIFVHSGINQLLNFSGTVGYMQSKMGAVPVPLLNLLLAGALLFSLLGSVMIALGWQARMGAMLLFLFLLVITPVMHNFWAAPPDSYQLQVIQFEKNLAIIGGLWILMAAGPGPFALDKPRD